MIGARYVGLDSLRGKPGVAGALARDFEQALARVHGDIADTPAVPAQRLEQQHVLVPLSCAETEDLDLARGRLARKLRPGLRDQ